MNKPSKPLLKSMILVVLCRNFLYNKYSNVYPEYVLSPTCVLAVSGLVEGRVRSLHGLYSPGAHNAGGYRRKDTKLDIAVIF